MGNAPDTAKSPVPIPKGGQHKKIGGPAKDEADKGTGGAVGK